MTLSILGQEVTSGKEVCLFISFLHCLSKKVSSMYNAIKPLAHFLNNSQCSIPADVAARDVPVAFSLAVGPAVANAIAFVGSP
jgi:hypothetical protein